MRRFIWVVLGSITAVSSAGCGTSSRPPLPQKAIASAIAFGNFAQQVQVTVRSDGTGWNVDYEPQDCATCAGGSFSTAEWAKRIALSIEAVKQSRTDFGPQVCLGGHPVPPPYDASSMYAGGYECFTAAQIDAISYNPPYVDPTLLANIEAWWKPANH